MTDTMQNDNKKRKIDKTILMENENKKMKIDQIMEENKDAFTYIDEDDAYWRRKCNDCMTHVENRVIKINEEKKKVKIRGAAIVLNYKIEFLDSFLFKLATEDNFFETIHNTYYDDVTPKCFGKPSAPISP